MIPASAQDLKRSPVGRVTTDPLSRALNLYDAIEALLSGGVDAAPEHRLRLAARVINLCHELDVALDRAGLNPMGDRGRR